MEMTDLEARTELSKVLDAPKNFEYGSSKQKVYSWAEVFNQIGRLQERATIREINVCSGDERDCDIT